MAFIAWHDDYTLPLPQEHRFPMAKYQLLHDQLLYEGVVVSSDFFAPEKIDKKFLEGVHAADYYERLLQLQLTPKEIRRIGFPLSQHLVDRELRIAQGTIECALEAQKNGLGMNISGGTHHAGSNWGEGFCLLNDQAIAAHYLWKNKLAKRILIIDLDVHQGNGTAEIFQNNPAIFTFSMHGQNNFPFRKEHSDLDVGLPDGTKGEEYLQRLQDSLKQIFQRFSPEFVFFLAGADVIETDKLGRMKLTQQDCKERDQLVFETCKKRQLPCEVSMGGGYSTRLADIVNTHCQTYKQGISILK